MTPLSEKPAVSGQQWLQADLHVHTSVSRCFESQRCTRHSNAEAKALLAFAEEVASSGIDIVAITDHNEIHAYWRLEEIRGELEAAIASLRRSNLEVPSLLTQQLASLDSVVFLPGCELDVFPSIHLTVLFDPATDQRVIDDFLTAAGFPQEQRGSENESQIAKWSVQQALSQIDNIGAIGIAAHADSSRGLYNASRDWNGARAAAFKHAGLYAMEFSNPVNRDKIIGLMQQPQYHRDTQLSFIQSSDFHGKVAAPVGYRSTWVRFDHAAADSSDVFRSLKIALRNPNECVSAPGRPEFQDIQARLDSQPHIAGIVEDSDKTMLLEFACAFANSADGTIVIGRNKQRNWIGVECVDEEELETQVRDLLSVGIHPLPAAEITIYPEYGTRALATVRIRTTPGTHVLTHTDSVHILRDGIPVALTTGEVVEHAESALIRRYRRLSVSPRLAQTSRKLEGLTDSIDILPLFRRIEKMTDPIPMHFRLYEGGIMGDNLRSNCALPFNGFAQGDFVIAIEESPRMETQYTRIHPPLGIWLDADAVDQGIHKFSGPAMIVAPGGALHLLRSGSLPVFGEPSYPYVLCPRLECPDPAVCIAFLESAVGLWFAERCLGSVNYHNLQSVLLRSRVPKPASDLRFQAIEGHVDALLSLELEFLRSYGPSEMMEGEANAEFKARMAPVVDRHNEAAASIFKAIDSFFFDYFEVSAAERRIIEVGLRAARLVQFLDESGAT